MTAHRPARALPGPRTALLVLAVVLVAAVSASAPAAAGLLCRPVGHTATTATDRTVALDVVAVQDCRGRLRITGRMTSTVPTIIWLAAESDPMRAPAPTGGRMRAVRPVVVGGRGVFDEDVDMAAIIAPRHVLRLWLARTTPAGDVLLRGLRYKNEALTSNDLAVLTPGGTVVLVAATDVRPADQA